MDKKGKYKAEENRGNGLGEIKRHEKSLGPGKK